MRKSAVLIGLLVILLSQGCGSDKGTNNNKPPELQSVTAATGVAAPQMTSVNEAVWNQVPVKALAIKASNVPPSASAKPSDLSDSVWVQAINVSGRLYLRLEWSDDSLHMDCEVWKLIDVANFNFSRQSGYEDQVYVMFQDSGSVWDTWNWRVLTTAQARKAEDLSWNGDSLLLDSGLTQTAWDNRAVGSRPTWVHKDQHLFTGQVMYINDTLNSNVAVAGRHNWTVGQTVPGWIIDTTVNKPTWTHESRWDVDAIYTYNAETDRYVVVMARDLAGSSDDLDMSDMARVRTKIGILDNLRSLTVGSNHRGFTADFWLVLQ